MAAVFGGGRDPVADLVDGEVLGVDRHIHRPADLFDRGRKVEGVDRHRPVVVGVGQGGDQAEDRGLARARIAGDREQPPGGVGVGEPVGETGQGGVAPAEPPALAVVVAHRPDQEPFPELDLAALGVGFPFPGRLQRQVDIGHPAPVVRVVQERRLAGGEPDTVGDHTLPSRIDRSFTHLGGQRMDGDRRRAVPGRGERFRGLGEHVGEQPGLGELAGLDGAEDHDPATGLVLGPVAGVVLQGRGGEIGAALARVAGIEQQQQSPDRGLVEHDPGQISGAGRAVQPVRAGVGGDQDMLAGAVQPLTVAGEVDRQDVGGPAIRVPAEIIEGVEQLAGRRVHRDSVDQGVAEPSGEQPHQIRARLPQTGPVPARPGDGVFGDRGRDQEPPRPPGLIHHAIPRRSLRRRVSRSDTAPPNARENRCVPACPTPCARTWRRRAGRAA